MNNSEYRKQLMTDEWKQLSAKILIRDNHTCRKCGAKGVRLNVHHITYIKGLLAWEYSDEYLVTLCSKCHTKIHSKEPSFVKFYSERSSELKQLAGHELIALFSLFRYMNYDNTIDLSVRLKESVKKELGISYQSLNNLICKISKTNVLMRISNNSFLVNPRYFAKGDWCDIKNIDFEKSVSSEIPTQNI